MNAALGFLVDFFAFFATSSPRAAVLRLAQSTTSRAFCSGFRRGPRRKSPSRVRQVRAAPSVSYGKYQHGGGDHEGHDHPEPGFRPDIDVVRFRVADIGPA